MIHWYSLRQQGGGRRGFEILLERVEWPDDGAPAFFVYPRLRPVAAQLPADLTQAARMAAAAGVFFDVYALSEVVEIGSTGEKTAEYVYDHTAVVRD